MDPSVEYDAAVAAAAPTAATGDKPLEKPAPSTERSTAAAPLPPSVAADTNLKEPADKVKTKRTALSLHEKCIVKMFCDQQISASKARADFVPSHDVLRQEIATKFGWELGRSTLSKILCVDWQKLQAHSHPNPNMKRKRKPLFPAFEADLVQAIRMHLAQQESMSQLLVSDAADAVLAAKSGPVLTEAIILEEAQKLKQQHGIKDEELVLSVGWLARFKHRNGIRLRKGALTSVVQGSEGLTAPALMVGQEASETVTKRVKRNDAVALSTAIPTRWQDSFQFPAAYTTSVAMHQAFSMVASLRDLRGNCSNHATLESDANCGSEIPPQALLEAVPEIVRAFACQHCPLSVPLGIEGLHVLVVGSNCVRDAFVLAALVGAPGSVTCFETNPEAAAVGEASIEDYTTKTLGLTASNLRIVSGSNLDQNSSISHLVGNKNNLVFFNCSFHAAAHKAQLLELAFNLLQEGGECRLSYVSSSRRLTQPPLPSAEPTPPRDELAAASMYIEDFRRMCQHVGFLDPRGLSVRKYQLDSGDGTVGAAPFDLAVTTMRLFKLGLIEDRAEDYGERATYTGGGSSAEALELRLDTQFTFIRDVSAPVDGNTSQIFRRSWLKRVFVVEGDRSTHHGRFTYSL